MRKFFLLPVQLARIFMWQNQSTLVNLLSRCFFLFPFSSNTDFLSQTFLFKFCRIRSAHSTIHAAPASQGLARQVHTRIHSSLIMRVFWTPVTPTYSGWYWITSIIPSTIHYFVPARNPSPLLPWRIFVTTYFDVCPTSYPPWRKNTRLRLNLIEKRCKANLIFQPTLSRVSLEFLNVIFRLFKKFTCTKCTSKIHEATRILDFNGLMQVSIR